VGQGGASRPTTRRRSRCGAGREQATVRRVGRDGRGAPSAASRAPGPGHREARRPRWPRSTSRLAVERLPLIHALLDPGARVWSMVAANRFGCTRTSIRSMGFRFGWTGPRFHLRAFNLSSEVFDFGSSSSALSSLASWHIKLVVHSFLFIWMDS
jgi:hypothetical protein